MPHPIVANADAAQSALPLCLQYGLPTFCAHLRSSNRRVCKVQVDVSQATSLNGAINFFLHRRVPGIRAQFCREKDRRARHPRSGTEVEDSLTTFAFVVIPLGRVLITRCAKVTAERRLGEECDLRCGDTRPNVDVSTPVMHRQYSSPLVHTSLLHRPVCRPSRMFLQVVGMSAMVARSPCSPNPMIGISFPSRSWRIGTFLSPLAPEISPSCFTHTFILVSSVRAIVRGG